MFLQLTDIQKLFSDYPSKLLDTGFSNCISSYMALPESDLPTSYSVHCLYVTQQLSDLKRIEKEQDKNILLLIDLPPEDFATQFSAELAASKNRILLLQTSDLRAVCEKLQTFFDDHCGIGLLSDSLMGILFFEGGIQAMIEKAYPAFMNPIYVFDTDFQLIAATKDVEKNDHQGEDIIRAGGFTPEAYQVLNLSGNFKRLKKSEFPIRTKHPLAGFDQMLCTIDTQRDMGHIVLNGLNHPLSDMDMQMLYVLKKAIDQQLKKDEFVRNNRGFHHEYFLRDLLDGKIAVGKAYEHRLDYINTEFSGTLYCMFIETARSSYTLNTMHIRTLFETMFSGTMTLMYNGGILILFRFPTEKSMSAEDTAAILEVCLEYGLYAGMGNSFSNILHIKEYYKQALRSIELGICQTNEPSLFLYEDYYLAHLASVFTQKESAETFCHPKMKFLLEYDRENETDLAHILYVYLISERNIAVASQALYMHRNTLVYRLKKITSLISSDLDNYLERQHMILSYELVKREDGATH